MAYSKRRYSRRPARRYRRYRRSMASKALYLARKANKSELKWHTTLVGTPITFSTNRYIRTLSDIAQGTGGNNRVGLVLTPTSINLSLLMQLGDLGVMSHSVRVILFLWRTERYDVTTDGDYLQTADVLSYKDERKRFMSKTLYDRTFSLSPNGTRQMSISIKRKIKGMMSYSDAADNTQNKNQLVLAIYTDTKNGDPDPSVTFNSRLYFTDK